MFVPHAMESLAFNVAWLCVSHRRKVRDSTPGLIPVALLVISQSSRMMGSDCLTGEALEYHPSMAPYS
jgi:hypothetical protein